MLQRRPLLPWQGAKQSIALGCIRMHSCISPAFPFKGLTGCLRASNCVIHVVIQLLCGACVLSVLVITIQAG
jgi:hypothetical protein